MRLLSLLLLPLTASAAEPQIWLDGRQYDYVPVTINEAAEVHITIGGTVYATLTHPTWQQVEAVIAQARERRTVESDGFYVSWQGDEAAISGPWHNGRHVWYATLQAPTQQQVQAALATAKATWSAERQVSRAASPKAANADGDARLPVGSVEALDEVNRQRAEHGLHAYLRDDGLMLAAAKCAAYRAANGIRGHTNNDFNFLPKGAFSNHAGCAAWQSGFGACFIFDSGFKYAGAAYSIGPDGLRFCQIFVR